MKTSDFLVPRHYMGKLKVDEFLWVDGEDAVVVLLENNAGQRYVGMLSEKDKDKGETWLFAMVNTKQVKQLCGGDISLYDVFGGYNRGLYKVYYGPYGQLPVTEMTISHFIPELLPREDSFIA